MEKQLIKITDSLTIIIAILSAILGILIAK